MKELNVGIVACASMQEQIEECLASLESSLRIYPIIPSCSFSVKIELFRHYLDKSTAENDVTLLVYGICHPQILPLLAEYGDGVVKVGGSNCYEMFLGSEKYTECHRNCYWMLNKPFFTKWKSELLTGFGADTSNGRALIGDTFKKLAYLRFEKDELSVDVVEDFAKSVGLEYEIQSADMANLKRLLEEALASADSTGMVKAQRPLVKYPQESELRTLVESIGEVIYKIDIHTKQVTFVSPQVKRILGYTPAEFLDVTDDYLRTPFYHEDDRQQVAARRYKFLVRCLNEGMQEPYEAEYRVKHKNGNNLWVRESIYPSYNPGGIIESFVGKLEDITERKQMEEALRESEEKWRSLVENALNMIIIVDREGTIQFANRTPSGINVKDVIGRNAYDYVQPEYQDVMKGTIKRIFDTGEHSSFEVRGTGPDGQVSWYETQAGPIKRDGRVVAVTLITVDVTERKRAEEEELRKFKTISDRAGYGAVVTSPDGNLVYINEVFAGMHGYTVEELIGKHLSIFHTEEQMKLVERLVNQLLETGSYAAEEVWHKTKDGMVFPTLMTGTAIIDDKGKPLYLCATAIDITERKRVEEALQESEQNFRNSLENSPLGIRVVTSEGELLYANQAILDIYGYSSVEELKLTPVKQRYTPNSYAKHLKRKEKRKQGKPVPDNYGISIVRKDGQVRHLAVFRKEVIWDGKREFQVLYQDITEHKRAEEALRQSEEFNSSLLANSPSPMFVLNSDASIRYVNPALEKLTGFSSLELIGKKPPYPWWIKKNREKSSKRLGEAMHRRTRKREELFRKKNGELFWVEITRRPVKVNGEVKYCLANWVDLTERKRLRENMEFYISAVTKAQEEERKRIAREIHDDSVQSLAALALELDAVAKQKEQLPEEVIQKLKGLRTGTNNILDGLRRFSHRLRPGLIDQVGLIPALEVLAEELGKEETINTTLEIMGSERRLTLETELVLFRIAQEALRNVRRHSGATKAAIKLRFTRGKVRLTILDNGKGFEMPEMLGDFAAKGKLGLIGMQERARLLDSKLLVRSRVGRGTAVMVEVSDIG